jgi:hypothetical protein
MMTRRTVLARAAISVAAGIAAPSILAWPAGAAEFAYKYGTALPDGHPMAIRSREAIAKIKEENGGRLDITFYPSSVLGQDTAMMSQAIAGALEIYGMSLDILAQGALRGDLRYRPQPEPACCKFVAGLNGPRWFRRIGVCRRELLDPFEGRVEQPVRRGPERVGRRRRNVGQVTSESDI